MSSNARRDGVSFIQSSFKNNKKIATPILPATTITTSSLSSENPKSDNLAVGSGGFRQNDNKTFIENNNKRLKLHDGYNEVVEFDTSESSASDNDNVVDDDDYHVDVQQNGYCSDTSDSDILDDGDGIEKDTISNDDSDDSEDNEEENKSNIFINISTDTESGADENIEEIVIKDDNDDKGTKANGNGGSGNNNEDKSKGKYINWFIPPSPATIETQEKSPEPIVCINLEEEEKERLRKKEYALAAIIKANKNRMICNVCDILFTKKNLYVHHIDRHFSDDHFKCPHCFRGYTKLTLCQAHEIVYHKAPLHTTVLKTVAEDLDNYIVASTALYPYRGPAVKFQQDSYLIESEHGRNKKSYASIVANYANHFRRIRKPQYESPTKKKSNGESDTDFEGDDDSSKKSRSHSSKTPSVLTIFMCSLCGFGNPKEEELRNHQLRKHPNIPLSKLLQTFKVGSAAEAASETKSSPVSKSKSKIVPIPKVPLIQPPKLEVIENMKLEIMKNKKIRKMNKNDRKIGFLFKLGLVPSQKFYSTQGIPRGFTNNNVKVYDCSKLRNKSHFLMCLVCSSNKSDYFALNKAEMEQHRLANHPDKVYGDIVKLFLRGNVGEDDWGMTTTEPPQQPDYYSFLGKLGPRKRKTLNYYNNYPSDDSSKSKRSYVKTQNKKQQQPRKKTKRKKKKLNTTGNRKSKGDLTSSGSDFY